MAVMGRELWLPPLLIIETERLGTTSRTRSNEPFVMLSYPKGQSFTSILGSNDSNPDTIQEENKTVVKSGVVWCRLRLQRISLGLWNTKIAKLYKDKNK